MGGSLLLKGIVLVVLQLGTGAAVTADSCARSAASGVEAVQRTLLQTGATAAINEVHAGGQEFKEAGGPKVHESVFKIKYNDFNNTKFWSMAAFVCFYTWVIHELKNMIQEWSKEDESKKVLVEQMFAEVMLFGVMALSVFVSSQAVTLSMSTFHIFELAHLLISFAAFLMILAGIILGQLSKWEDKYLKRLYSKRMVDVRRATKNATKLQELPTDVVERAFLDITRSQFFSHHRLDSDTFSWSIYLIECLRSNVCKLIEIQPITWVVLFTISAWIWGVHFVFGDASFIPTIDGNRSNLGSYMSKLVLANWVCLVALAVVALQARRSVLQMKHMLGVADVEELRLALGVADPGVRVVDRFAMRREYHMGVLMFRCKVNFIATQVTAVITAILLGFYFMHVLYNLLTFRMPWYWHCLFLAPPLINFTLLLPIVLLEHTEVQSFVEPDSDVIDEVIEAVGQAWQDLLFVQRQLEAKARSEGIVDSGSTQEYYKWAMQQCEEADRNASKSGMVDGQFSAGDFARALTYIGVHVSKIRAKRLFKVINHEKPLMKYSTFLQHVFPTKAIRVERSPRVFTILDASESEAQL